MADDNTLRQNGEACSHDDDNAKRVWQEIAREMKEKQDPIKMVQLWRELDQAMLEAERRRVRLRLEQKKRTAA